MNIGVSSSSFKEEESQLYSPIICEKSTTGTIPDVKWLNHFFKTKQSEEEYLTLQTDWN